MDDQQIQVVIVAICLITFGDRMSILFVIKSEDYSRAHEVVFIGPHNHHVHY